MRRKPTPAKKKARKPPAKKVTKKARRLSTESTAKKRKAFLSLFARTGNITFSAKKTGIERSTHYKRWMKDPFYAEAFNSAREEASDVLEGEAWRRAMQGVEEPVFHRGKICGHVQKYSDVLLIFLLKGNRPEKFRERVEHTGKGGGPIEQKVTIYIPENQRKAAP